MLAHYDLLDSIIKEKLKTDLTKPNVRVEVDKYVYDPSLTTEMQFVQLEVKEPTITTPSPSGEKLLNPSSVGTMIPPIKGLKVENLKRYISSPYGDRIHPLTGKKDTHKGIDLAFPQGTKVVAAADGRILRIYNQGVNTIEILHANGVLTRYLHVAFPAKKAGEKVRQGEIIAEIGPKDAYSTGPHLHFEVLINYDTKNPKDAQHVDPMEYLLGKKFIVPNTQKKEEIKSDLYGTVTAKSGLNIRSGPSTGYKVIGTIPYNGRCKILEMYKDSEWYKVEYAGIQGYSYKYYIQLDSAGGTTSTTTTRPGGNPSYIEIYNYIKEVCNQIGLPPQIGWAIAWKESMWTQFKDDGTPLFNDNGTSADWGIMQINDVAHPDAFPQAKTDWRFNVQYGLKYAYSKYVKAKTMYLDATSIARATYSAYNTGSNYTRWESGTDERDNRFYEIYLTSPWNKNLSAGGEGLIGFINSSIVNLRSSPEYKPDNIVATLKKGFLVSIVGYQNNWYQVVLQDGQSGYIESKYIKRVEDDLLYEFDVNKIFTSNFSQYQQGQVPPASIYSQNKNQWKVGSDNKESVLMISGFGKGQSSFSIILNVTYTGRVDFFYKIDLAEGNYFKVYVNEKLCYIDGNKKTDEFIGTSVSLMPGTNVIKFERDKTVDGNDKIEIKEIVGFEYVFKDEEQEESLAEVTVDVDSTYIAVVRGEKAEIYTQPDKNSELRFEAEKGQVFIVEPPAEINKWLKLKLDDGTEGYVLYDFNIINVQNQGALVYDIVAYTGGFKYEKTITLDNVISVSLDRRYDMRVAEATIVIDNSDGRYTPDAKIYNFQYKGILANDLIKYEGGKPYSVFSENSMIRIYLGYGTNLQRVFTGLIDSVDVDGENGTITIKCSDLMKKLNEYYTYKPLNYPPDNNPHVAWLVSAVIHDLVKMSGLVGWRVREEDLRYPDVIIENTIYTDLKPESNVVTKYNEDGEPEVVKIESVIDEKGYKNPLVFQGTVPEGVSLGDYIEDICQNINYWQRCDEYGTYWCTPIQIDEVPVATFKDGVDLISLNKTIDTTRVRNHIIVSDGVNNEHFFDKDLWKMLKGERRSCKVNVDWAKTYGQKKLVATKMFEDMKRLSRTLQVAILGNPYIQLFDTVLIEHSKTMTYDRYYVKGIRHNFSVENGFITYLDLYWLDS